MATATARAATAQSLAYWFLRLNGFLTIENFILHRELGDIHKGMRTDADVLGIRFPYRAEQSMQDHNFFRAFDDKPIFLISEVVSGSKCKVNGAWSNPRRGNLNRLLLALGFLPPNQTQNCSRRLHARCCDQTDEFWLQYAAFGYQMDEHLAKRFPALLQLTWEEVLHFIHQRFANFRIQKADNQTWRTDGRELWKQSQTSERKFIDNYLAQLKS
jgi:hypothetical protein